LRKASRHSPTTIASRCLGRPRAAGWRRKGGKFLPTRSTHQAHQATVSSSWSGSDAPRFWFSPPFFHPTHDSVAFAGSLPTDSYCLSGCPQSVSLSPNLRFSKSIRRHSRAFDIPTTPFASQSSLTAGPVRAGVSSKLRRTRVPQSKEGSESLLQSPSSARRSQLGSLGRHQVVSETVTADSDSNKRVLSDCLYAAVWVREAVQRGSLTARIPGLGIPPHAISELLRSAATLYHSCCFLLLPHRCYAVASCTEGTSCQWPPRSSC